MKTKAKILYYFVALCSMSVIFDTKASTAKLAANGTANGAVRMEAESAALSGALRVANARAGFSGEGYVTGFNQAESNKFSGAVLIPKAGHYAVIVRAASDSYKENAIMLDGMNAGTLATEKPEFENIHIGTTYLEAGGHEVAVREIWGWFYLDFIEFAPTSPVPDEVYANIGAELSNPNANEKTRRVMKFLAANYGKKIIAGQYAAHNESYEIEAIKNATGKLPALRGFDMIFYSPNSDWNHDGEVPLAIERSRNGGLVSFSWHWHAPTGPSSFYSSESNFDLRGAMPSRDLATNSLEDIRAMRQAGEISEATLRLFSDIDAISEQLQRLQARCATVLWRPLHEASGGWFWWGAQGAEPYLWLFRTLHRRQTILHKLDNLIWVWNGQHADWHPGDEYVDIVGMDLYAEKRDYSADSGQFMRAARMPNSAKIVALTENGVIPDPDLLRRDRVMWSWFNTWYGDFIIGADRLPNGVFTELEMLKKIYNHELVITLDELPAFEGTCLLLQ